MLCLGKVVEKVVNECICTWDDGNQDQAAGLSTALLYHTNYYLYTLWTQGCVPKACVWFAWFIFMIYFFNIYERVEKEQKMFLFVCFDS